MRAGNSPPTGHICDTVTVGPISPQLIAAVTAHAAGLNDKAREHFETARREARENAVSDLSTGSRLLAGTDARGTIGGTERSTGLAMIRAALTDFRHLGMLLYANLAQQFLQRP